MGTLQRLFLVRVLVPFLCKAVLLPETRTGLSELSVFTFYVFIQKDNSEIEIFRKYIPILFVKNLRYNKKLSQMQLIHLIQINMYLVQVSYMFQPYVVIIRLAHKKENKCTVVFRIEISVLYIGVCVKHIHIKLDSLMNIDDESRNI